MRRRPQSRAADGAGGQRGGRLQKVRASARLKAITEGELAVLAAEETELENGDGDEEDVGDEICVASAGAGGGLLPQKTDDLDEGEQVVYNKLRDYTHVAAAAEDVEPYMIAQKRSLLEMVRMRPHDELELLSIWGLGAAKIQRHGSGLLEILNDPLNHVHLRQGSRPILDFKDNSGVDVVSTGATRRRLDGSTPLSKLGDRWKALGWSDLDTLLATCQGTLSLRHNASNIFRTTIADGDSLAEALQRLADVGKRRANHRITGFIKVVDNTTLDDMPLSLLLENSLTRKRAGS